MSARRRRGGSVLAFSPPDLRRGGRPVVGAVMAILGSEIACLGGGGSALAAPATQAAVATSRLVACASPGGRDSASTSTGLPRRDRRAGVWRRQLRRGQQLRLRRADADRQRAGGRRAAPDRADDLGAYRVDADGGGADRCQQPRRRDLHRCPDGAEVTGPPAGGSYAAYREAACDYYGACSDGAANYADEVMARAVSYGFDGKGSPPSSSPAAAEPAASGGGSGCGSSSAAGASGNEIVRIAQSQLGTPEAPRGRTATPTGRASNGARCSSPGSGSGRAFLWRAAPRPTPTRARVYEWAKAHEGGGLTGATAPGDPPLLHRRAQRRPRPAADARPGPATPSSTAAARPTPTTSASSSASSPAGRSRRSTATSATGSPAPARSFPRRPWPTGCRRRSSATPTRRAPRTAPMADRLRAFLDRPLDPSAARAIVAFASAILLGLAALFVLAASEPGRPTSRRAPAAAVRLARAPVEEAEAPEHSRRPAPAGPPGQGSAAARRPLVRLHPTGRSSTSRTGGGESATHRGSSAPGRRPGCAAR